MDLSKYYTLVENSITQLGIDPIKSRGEQPGTWNLQKGSVRVWLDLWFIEREQRAYFQVMSPVLEIPSTGKEAFFEELLKINDQLFGVAFSLYNGWAWLKVIREVEGMDAVEALAMLSRVGNYADHYDDLLKAKYQPANSDGLVGYKAPSE